MSVLGSLHGLIMKGALAFCADFYIDAITCPTYGATESLQSTVRTRMYSMCLDSPVLANLCSSQAEGELCPLGCHMVVRWALAFGGGPA